MPASAAVAPPEAGDAVTYAGLDAPAPAVSRAVVPSPAMARAAVVRVTIFFMVISYADVEQPRTAAGSLAPGPFGTAGFLRAAPRSVRCVAGSDRRDSADAGEASQSGILRVWSPSLRTCYVRYTAT